MGHLSLEQRYKIEAYTVAGYKDNKIAQQLGVDKSVISREKKRNSDQRNGVYRAHLAQRKADARKTSKNKYKRFEEGMRQRIEQLVKQDYSPEQVKGYCDKNSLDCVSHERIYQHIWADKKSGGTLFEHLRRKGRKYRKRGNLKDTRGLIINRVGIDERPAIVEEKSRFGDFEVDTIIGKNHQGAIVTVNDRASGFFKMKKVANRTAELVKEAVIELLMPIKDSLFTMTADNGKEFALHEQIAQALDIDFYFAKPYHPWQRGANENINGLVRQYIPKKADFSEYTDEFIEIINLKINQRPRKRFHFENPIFVAQKLTNSKVAFVT